jgi:hypothetical protein
MRRPAFIKVTAPAIPRLCGQAVLVIKEKHPRFHKCLMRFFGDCCANAKQVWLTKRLIHMVNFWLAARVADSEIRAFVVYGA